MKLSLQCFGRGRELDVDGLHLFLLGQDWGRFNASVGRWQFMPTKRWRRKSGFFAARHQVVRTAATEHGPAGIGEMLKQTVQPGAESIRQQRSAKHCERPKAYGG